MKPEAIQPTAPRFDGLLRELRAVDVVQVRTCWGVGRRASRRQFWTHCVQNSERGAFQICDALRHELNCPPSHTSACRGHAAKDASIARYSVLHGSEKLFATRYKLVLPSEEELRRELIREQRALEERAGKGKVKPAGKIIPQSYAPLLADLKAAGGRSK